LETGNNKIGRDTVPISLIKELRMKTKAGVMDCRNALQATGGDIEKAIQWLSENAKNVAAKKSGRVAKEGVVATAVVTRPAHTAHHLVSLSTSGCTLSYLTSGVLLELNSETDFAARSPDFVAACCELASQYLQSVHHVGADDVQRVSLLTSTADEPERLLDTVRMKNGCVAREWLNNLISLLKENVVLRRAHRFHYVDACSRQHDAEREWSVPVLSFYTHQALHTATTPSFSNSSAASVPSSVNGAADEEISVTLGQGTALVAFRVRGELPKSSGPRPEPTALLRAVRTFGRSLALHIFAREPRFIRPQQPPPSLVGAHVVTTATTVQSEDGEEESSLLLQRWMPDDSISVQEALRAFEQQWRVSVHIDDWMRYRVGDSIVVQSAAATNAVVPPARSASVTAEESRR
jgi:translation elongation factor EF-Ts